MHTTEPLRANDSQMKAPARGDRGYTDDVTYVSLNFDNLELHKVLPWAGTNRGPQSIVDVFNGIGKVWETKAFEVRDVITNDTSVAMFGSFTCFPGKVISGCRDRTAITSVEAECENPGCLKWVNRITSHRRITVSLFAVGRGPPF
jgi:hypothetical protein